MLTPQHKRRPVVSNWFLTKEQREPSSPISVAHLCHNPEVQSAGLKAAGKD